MAWQRMVVCHALPCPAALPHCALPCTALHRQALCCTKNDIAKDCIAMHYIGVLCANMHCQYTKNDIAKHRIARH